MTNKKITFLVFGLIILYFNDLQSARSSGRKPNQSRSTSTATRSRSMTANRTKSTTGKGDRNGRLNSTKSKAAVYRRGRNNRDAAATNTTLAAAGALAAANAAGEVVPYQNNNTSAQQNLFNAEASAVQGTTQVSSNVTPNTDSSNMRRNIEQRFSENKDTKDTNVSKN